FTIGANPIVAEDSGALLLAGWATNIRAGPDNESSQSVSFLITGNTIPGLFSASPAIAPSGTLSFTPAPDANGSATITLVLQDNDITGASGTESVSPQAGHIGVRNVNEAPSCTSGPNPMGTEGPRTRPLTGSA